MTFPQTGWSVNTGGNFNFQDNETAGYDSAGAVLNAGQTGNEFASSSFIGAAQQRQFLGAVQVHAKDEIWLVSADDDVKVTKNLNLTLGLRLDWQGGLYEKLVASLRSILPLPILLASREQPSITTRRRMENPAEHRSTIRIRVLVSIRKPSSVVDTACTMPASTTKSWDPYPVDGYQTNPSAPNTTNGLAQAFYFNGTGTTPPRL